MKTFQQTVWIAGAINASLYIIAYFEPPMFFGFFGICIVECVVGIALLFVKDSKSIGQGLILAGSLCLLIGFAVCTMMIGNI